MSGETYVTLLGRLTSDPELRFTPSGAAVANFTIATNARKFNRQSNEWESKPTRFWRCEAWNAGRQELADNIAGVLRKGDSVIAYGEIETREWSKDGEKRTADQLRIETIGKDLRWHTGASEPHRPTTDAWGNADHGEPAF